MRIGITGGNGFIGGHVVETAVAHGHDIVVLDRHGHLHEPCRSLMDAGNLSVMLGDVRNPVDMAELAAHVDGVIHLAACLGTQETVLNPMPAAETNILGGVNWLQGLAQYKIPGVYIGVGNHWMNNSYSITKTAVERFVSMYNRERGTSVNVVRVVNAYGPRQSVAPPFGPAKVRKITPAFVCRALTGQPIEVYGDGEQVSDMVSVRDAARALVVALEKAAAGIVFDRVVEVGPAPEDSLTVNQVAEYVTRTVEARGLGSRVPITHLPMRPGEIPGARVSADVSTLPLVDMSADTLTPFRLGIAETIEWFAENWLPGWRQAQEADQDGPGNFPRQDS
jgi:UDP-glucose 4-epimerase